MSKPSRKRLFERRQGLFGDQFRGVDGTAAIRQEARFFRLCPYINGFARALVGCIAVIALGGGCDSGSSKGPDGGGAVGGNSVTGTGGSGIAGAGAGADCRTGGACPAMMYCDPADGVCKNDCACGPNQMCDVSSHTCACITDFFHDCSGVCASNSSPDTCGASCTPCALPADPNALATTCTYGVCGFTCKPGYGAFGSGCASIGSWSGGPTVPTARAGFSVVGGLDGRIYVLGGWDNTNTPLAVVEVYTPSTNSWKTLASLTTPRAAFGAVAVGASAGDFTIYAVGGLGSGSSLLDSVEKYDPAGDSWTAAPSMPFGLQGLSATTATDATGATSIYIHATYDSNGSSDGAELAFSPTSQQWTMPAAATGMPSNVLAGWMGINDTIYLPYGTTYAYKPSTNTWGTVASMPTGTEGYFPAVAGKGGQVYVFGGGVLDSSLTFAETYMPGVDKWLSLTSLPMGLSAPVAATGGDGRIYVFVSGGSDIPSWPAAGTSQVFTP
jgi:N-acetylneuraminic acid mutarotase